MGGRGQALSGRLPDKVATQLRHELNLIERMELCAVFPDGRIASFASRARKAFSVRAAARPLTRPCASCLASPRSIRCGKGLLFERFVSEERREPPDIDVDFEHERREEVIQWIYETYGRTRSALTAAVIALSRARRGARGRQGAGCAGRCHGRAGTADLGLERRRALLKAESKELNLNTRGPSPSADPRTCQAADRHATASLAASGRLCPHAGSP